ncbi:hypothetical protein MMC22_001883 [Lobaria immixta]|nr:hypothetical protein [Lobaria immixta]
MPRNLTYPKLPDNTVHRYNHRATYDIYAIHSIINSSKVVHVSFNAGDPAEGAFPSILPMIGQMGSFAYPSADLHDPLDCYLHGYVSSRVMKLAHSDEGKGLPVSIAATKVDGLVLSLTPNSHSYNYRSAVLFGHAKVVTEVEEKIWAMKLITESVVPGRWENTRVPPDGAEMSSTSILRVKIVSGSGKIRDGGPGDDKKDLERPDVTGRVWTGVVPVWETIGEPVAGETNRTKEVPEHVIAFAKKENEENENYAKKAVIIALPNEEAPK